MPTARAFAVSVRKLGLAATFASLAVAGPAAAQNLVQDPGFEDTVAPNGGSRATSSPGWMLNSDTFTYFATTGSGFTPNSGNWIIVFGDESPQTAATAVLSQVIPTVPGQQYAVSFFLANLGNPTDQFTATFGNQTLLSLSNAQPFPYTQYLATVVASSTQTTLSFVGEQVPSYFELDDISVVAAAPAPTPGAGALSFIAGLGGLLLYRTRRAAR